MSGNRLSLFLMGNEQRSWRHRADDVADIVRRVVGIHTDHHAAGRQGGEMAHFPLDAGGHHDHHAVAGEQPEVNQVAG